MLKHAVITVVGTLTYGRILPEHSVYHSYTACVGYMEMNTINKLSK